MKKNSNYNRVKDKNLPMDINTWVEINKPKEDLIFAKSFFNHINFVCDTLYTMIIPNSEERKNNQPMVISTIKSNSIKLPVIQIKLENCGIEIVLSYDFYNWKVSIKSKSPISIESTTFLNQEEEIILNYPNGFPKDKIYNSYKNNHSKFTIEIYSHYDLYILFYIIKMNININMKIKE